MKKINKKRVAFASLVIICLIIIIALIINLTILPLFNNSNGVTKNKQAKAKKETIEVEKLTGDNIYKVLIYFDKLYKVMNDVERRQLIEALISEIQIYEEKQPNGQWLKSITFKLPIIDEDLNISLENDEQVECVCLLVRK